jgi:hypothetical protein
MPIFAAAIGGWVSSLPVTVPAVINGFVPISPIP